MLSLTSIHTTPLPYGYQGSEKGGENRKTATAQESPEISTADSTADTNARDARGNADAAEIEIAAGDMTREEILEIERLQQRDREVRAHELAHLMAAGAYAHGGAHFQYESGPDGRRYAVGGEVGIDISKIPGDPQATLQKMRTVKRAALAPMAPSAQDRSVAARANQMELESKVELLQMKTAEADAKFRKQSETGTGETDIDQPRSTKVHVIA